MWTWNIIQYFSKRGLTNNIGFPGGPSGKESASQCRKHKRCRLNPWVGKIPWSREWLHTPVFLPENPMGRGAWQATVHGVTKNWTGLSDRAHTSHNKIIWNQSIRKPKSVYLCLCVNNVMENIKQHYSSLLDTWSWVKGSFRSLYFSLNQNSVSTDTFGKVL